MHYVDTPHPPGAVIWKTGEILRYPSSADSMEALLIPRGSMRANRGGALVSQGLNDGIRDAMMAHVTMPDRVPAPIEWVWIMGDDHRYAGDILLHQLDALLANDLDALAPLCLNRAPPFPPTVHRNGRNVQLHELPSRGLYRFKDGDTCGDSALLVRRRVLEALGDPWYDRVACGAFDADDQNFTQRIVKAGFKVAVTMDLQIGHTTPADIFPVLKEGRWCAQVATCDRPFVTVDVRRTGSLQ